MARSQHNKLQNKYLLLGYLIVIVVFLQYGWVLAHKINITDADIGRHIRNGEMFFQNWEVMKTNFYSFTHPDFPTPNHHWGAGVLFYLIWKVWGLVGVHIFFTVLSLLTFFVFYLIAIKQSSIGISSLASIAVIPLIAVRTEIRPEVFSYLFAGLFLWFLLDKQHINSKKLLYLFPLIEIVWVNVHIYFFLGPLIIGVFCIDSFLTKKEDSRLLMYVFALTSVATLVNPFGLEGALAPFNIFDNYGYSTAENVSIFGLSPHGKFSKTILIGFKILSLLIASTFIIAAVKQRKKILLPYLLLAFFVIMAALFAWRNLALFGFFSLPILSTNIATLCGKIKKEHERTFLWVVFLSLVVILALCSSGKMKLFYSFGDELGFGPQQGNTSAAVFFKNNNLRGPIFNNFDVGGYLIFYLYPQEKVFVDNRPEAYPKSFFENTYIPMQLNVEKWKEIDKKYNFNSIVINHRDSSNEMLQFKIARNNDPEWTLVYIDMYITIYSRRKL